MTSASEATPAKAPPITALTVIIAVSAPIAMGLETLLRTAFFPIEFVEVRDFLHEPLRPFAWACVGFTILFSVIGFIALRMGGPKAIANAPSLGKEPGKALVDRFMLTSSIPQVPAIAGTLMFMFGSPLLPVLVCMAISSAGVVAQGFVAKGLASGVLPSGPAPADA